MPKHPSDRILNSIFFIGVGLFLLIVLLFYFGNPQWSKWIFLWQRKVYANTLVIPSADYSGIWRIWKDNGQLESEATYLAGRINGSYSRWWDNGNLWQTIEYKNGVLHGKFSQCHKNGNPFIEKHYANGVLIGQFQTWHINGIQSFRGNYNNGKLNGQIQTMGYTRKIIKK